MKKLFFALLAALLALTLQAKPEFSAIAQISQSVQRAVSAAPKTPALTPRQQQIQEALKKQLPEPEHTDKLEYHSWIEFYPALRDMTEIMKSKHEWIQQIDKNFEELQLSMVRTGSLTAEWANKLPNYGKETKNVKYIFASDASSHDTHHIPVAVGKLMEQVRRENPQARILLATEFAITNGFDMPIRFAKTKNPQVVMLDNYEFLQKAADKTNIDILALDDACIEKTPADEKNYEYALKIGNKIVLVEKNSPTAKEVAEQYKELNLPTESVLRDFISRSMMGAQYRNDQWASYIKAVSPFYDKIIIYAGKSHFDDEYCFHALPDLIGQDYVQFDFYSGEKIDISKQLKVAAISQQLQASCQAQDDTDSENSPIWQEVCRKTNLLEELDWSKPLHMSIKFAPEKMTPQQKAENNEMMDLWAEIFGLREAVLRGIFHVFLPKNAK